MVRFKIVKLVFSSFLITGMTIATLPTTLIPMEEIVKHLDVIIPDANHDLNKRLHPSYIHNLQEVGSGELLLLHDTRGNLHESTYHYMALKIHELYEVVSNFLTNNSLRKTSDEIAEEDTLYLAHRGLMRHALSSLTLEFYMTLLYRSRQEALERLDAHYPDKTRRDIIQRQSVRNNFDEQFTRLMAKVRQVMSEQMLFSEKSFYWNCKLNQDEDEAVSEVGIPGLKKVQDYQSSMSIHLNEFAKLLKAKRKFYVEYLLPEEYAETRTEKNG